MRRSLAPWPKAALTPRPPVGGIAIGGNGGFGARQDVAEIHVHVEAAQADQPQVPGSSRHRLELDAELQFAHPLAKDPGNGVGNRPRDAAGMTHQVEFPRRFNHANLTDRTADIDNLLLGKKLFIEEEKGGGRQHIQFQAQPFRGGGAAGIKDGRGDFLHAFERQDRTNRRLLARPLHIPTDQENGRPRSGDYEVAVLHRAGEIEQVRILTDDGRIHFIPLQQSL